MKTSVAMAIARVVGKAVLFTIAVALVVGIIGYLYKWDSSRTYSDAFLVAGVLVVLGSVSSQMGMAQDWHYSQQIFSESFRTMSSADRAHYVINVSKSPGLASLGLMSGFLLIAISALLAILF